MTVIHDQNGQAITSANPLPTQLVASNVSQTPGSAVAGKDVQLLGASDGTNAQGLRVDAQKNLLVGLRSSGGAEPNIGSYPNSDALSAVQNAFAMGAFGLRYNGASWDRERGNAEGTLLASAARTATTSSSNQTNYNGRGVLLILNVTAASGSGGLTLRVQGVDPVSGLSVALNTPPAAITATGTFGYLVYPGIAGPNLSQASSTVLPRTWFVSMTHGDATSYTYSLGYALIL
jgi:hypothetical protein